MQANDFELISQKDQARVLMEHLNPLPRSVTRSGAFELLDGEWRFDLDLEDKGLSEQWYLNHKFNHTASWPGSVEAHMAAAKDIQQTTPVWQDKVVAWYEREFQLPEKWCYQVDCITQITFGACGYETSVWLNGFRLTTIEGEETHYGEYTSFSYELPNERLLPVNRLTVRIAATSDAEVPRGKQNSTVFKRGGIWYQTYTGAVRSVWLEPVEANRLRTRVTVISNYRDSFVAFDFTTLVHDPDVYTLRVVVSERGSNTPLAVHEYSIALEAGQKRQRVTLELEGASFWSLENPKLYGLVAQLIGRGCISQIEVAFGLRHIEARGRSVFLNNQPVYLDGILYQPGTATFEQMRAHLLAMKQLGCNLVRVHISGIDPRLYDLADEIGMLLWVEIPSPHSSSQRSRDNHWQELHRMLVFVGSHPSIVIWSMYNEDWGVQDIATNLETRMYIAKTNAYMRLTHPHILVVDNDGWQHVSVEGRLKSDLLTAHIYTPDLRAWGELLDRFTSGENEGVAVKPLVVGDPFFNVGQIPIIVSEWGGFGFSEYGGPFERAAKVDDIRAFKEELRRRPIAGDVYTQAVSIEDENNGLIDPLTGELQVPAGLLASSIATKSASEDAVESEGIAPSKIDATGDD